jgi:tetratricopeptide (TPR) repeat protein
MRNFAVLLATLLTLPLAANDWLAGTWIRAERKLDRAVAEAKTSAAEARLLAKRAHFLLDRNVYHRADSERARVAIDDALAAAKRSGDATAIALAMHARSRFLYFGALDGDGNFAAADASIDESLQVQELADAWFYRGLVRQMKEEYGPARAAFERVLAVTNDPLVRSFAHRHIGYLIELGGDADAARVHYRKSVDQRRESGAHVLVPFALNLLADSEKDRARAIELLHESTAAARCSKSWRALNAAETKLAELSANREVAVKHARRALDAAQSYGDAAMIAEARTKLAELSH